MKLEEYKKRVKLVLFEEFAESDSACYYHLLERLDIEPESSKPSLNNDFKKPCPECDGKGEVRSATKGIDGYDLEDCSECEGQGFIKS